MFQFDMKAVEKIVADGFKKQAPGMYAPAVREKVAELLREHEEQLKADPESWVELNLDVRNLRRQGLGLSVSGLLNKTFMAFPQYEYKVVSSGPQVKVEIRRKPVKQAENEIT